MIGFPGTEDQGWGELETEVITQGGRQLLLTPNCAWFYLSCGAVQQCVRGFTSAVVRVQQSVCGWSCRADAAYLTSVTVEIAHCFSMNFY